LILKPFPFVQMGERLSVEEEERERVLLEDDQGGEGMELGYEAPSHTPTTATGASDPVPPLFPPVFPTPKKKPSGAQRRKRKRDGVAGAAGGATPVGGASSCRYGALSILSFSSFYKKNNWGIFRDTPIIGTAVDERKKREREGETPESVKKPTKTRRLGYREQEGDEFFVYFRYRDLTKGRITASDFVGAMAEFRSAIDTLKGTTMVKMGGIKMRGGFVEIACHDEVTRLWSEGLAGTILDNVFEVVPVEEARATYRTVGMWVREPSPPKAEIIFPAILVQNGGLDTTRWHILRCMPSGGGHFLLVRLDEESFNKIKPPNRVYYYTDQLTFTLEPSKKEGNKGEVS
jgi:hypothetical protein